ncbi:class I SAM-dependent methyltransferase [Phenylobacterium sp.]|uniref:class I SAM-dependent methyltransferase n=1 Tax=Phenylobacterium sp. TaxID=1871053 RepID=UPI00374DAA80
MASLRDLLRVGRKPAPAPAPAEAAPGPEAPILAPAWVRPLFAADLAPQLRRDDGAVLVWTIEDQGSTAAITDQFKANAEEYHRRYAHSAHFERLFRQGIEATGITVAEAPLILDLGSGSGVNSIVPCQRIFPGARMVATDLSAELLAMLGAYAADEGAAEEVAADEGRLEGAAADAIVCVQMDAMSGLVAPGVFDLVTGASILHHLQDPQAGLTAAARALKPGGHAIFFEPFNGWGIMRLGFQWILAEAALRGEPLDPAIDTLLRATIADIAARSDPDTDTIAFRHMDDKWLFSRAAIEDMAREAGFAQARFKPHGAHPTLYRDMGAVQLRLGTGQGDLAFPAWATAILAEVDAAFTRDAKRELMMEGTIVLTKAR